MRYGLYVRKSTEEDERQAQSIEDQVRHAQELAKRNGIEIAEVYSESRSAKEEGRPEFNRLLRDIDRRKIDGIIVWHPDRLSRNETDGAAVTKRVRKGGIKDLLFVNYFFHNSPEGIMMLQIALSQSQYYSSKLSGDVKRGMGSKVRKGWHPHQAVPGYKNNKEMDKGDKTISPDPVRFPIIRRVFDHFLTGSYSGTKLVKIMNEEWGYRSPKTRKRVGGPMTKTTMYRTLANIFYAGYFIENGELHKGSHKAMISLDEHRRALALLGKLTRMQPKKHEFPFTGVIRCAKCGGMVTAQESINRQKHLYIYYRCTHCSGQCVSSDILQQQIDAEVDKVALIPDFVEWAIEEVNGWKKEDRMAQHAVYAQKASSLAAVDGQLESLLTALTKQLITDEEYEARKRKLRKEQANLKMEIGEAEVEAERVRKAIENHVCFLENVKAWMITGDVNLKRSCLQALGSDFILDGKTLRYAPHPLLTRIREENKELEAKYREIQLDKTLSETRKNELIQPIRSTWSGIWNLNQTLVRDNNVTFPKLSPFTR